MSIHEIDTTTIANTSNSSIPSFPHWTESFGDGGSRIVYELYRFWDEDLEVVSPQPFSYLLYGDGSHFWDTDVEGCTGSYTAKTLGEALECCAGSKEERDLNLLYSMITYYIIDSESDSDLAYEWHPGPCQEWHNRYDPNPTETNIPLADGQLYGNVTGDSLLIADPASDSCWFFTCHLYWPEDRPETCVGLLQKNLRLVSLEEFVGAMKDVICD